MNEQPNSKVVVMGPKSYDWMDESNYKIGTHMGNVSYKVGKYAATSGAKSKSAGERIVFNNNPADGFTSSIPRIRTTLPLKIEAAINGEIATEKLLIAALDTKIGLQSLPHWRMIQTSNVKLNNSASVTTSPSEIVDVVVNSMNPYNLAMMSQASVPDRYASYSGAAISNPLSSGANVDNPELTARGFGSNYSVTYRDFNKGGDASKAVVYADIVFESVIPSTAFQYENCKNSQPFYNLTNFTCDLTVNDVLPSVLAVNGSYDGTKFTIGDADPVDITSRLITMDDNILHELILPTWNPSVKLDPPSNLVYGSHEIDLPYRSPEVIKVLAGAKKQEIRFNSFLLASVPQMFAIVVRRPREVANLGGPHNFLPITNISLNMGNKSNLLMEHSQYDLYQMSLKNGYSGRFATFSSQLSSLVDGGSAGCGSVVYIKPSDLALNEGMFAGRNENLTITGNVTVDAVDQANPENCTLEIFAIYDAVTKFNGKSYKTDRVLIGKLGVVEADVKMVEDSSAENSLIGGSMLSDIWGWMRRVATSPMAKALVRHGRNNLPVVSDYAKDGTALGNIAKSQGYGKKRKTKGGEVTKVGGQVLSDSQLSSLLK